MNAIHARSHLRHWPTSAGPFMVTTARRFAKTFSVTSHLYIGGTGRGGVCRRSEPLVCEGQPAEKLAGGFVWRLAVEGHHRCRHARSAAKLGAPPVADRRHLNLVRAAANDFFEVMNDHVCVCPKGLRAATILFASARRSSEATDEGTVHSAKSCGSFAPGAGKIFAVWFSTAFARVINSFSTAGTPYCGFTDVTMRTHLPC